MDKFIVFIVQPWRTCPFGSVYFFYDGLYRLTYTHLYGVESAIKNIITRYTDFHVVANEWC
jgi:hypothetical protein